MSDRYRSLDEKPFDSHYLLEQIDIDAPVATVFEYARQIGNWMNAHDLETVDGTPWEVGLFERVFPKGIPADSPQPHHHVYGIAHVIPNRYIGLEVFPERGGSYGKTREWVSFDGIFLVELGPDRTRVLFHIVEPYLGEGSKEEYEAQAATQETLRTGLIIPYLKTLKAQAEG